MGNENETILDQLSDKHELPSLDLNYPDSYQVLQVQQDGRDLQVIVLLSYDDTWVGEVLASSMVGEIVFLLCPALLRPGDPDSDRGVDDAPGRKPVYLVVHAGPDVSRLTWGPTHAVILTAPIDSSTDVSRLTWGRGLGNRGRALATRDPM